jgi:hypothetical protein
MSDYRSHIRTEWPPERITAALQELAGAETERAHDVTCKFCRKTGSYKIPQADGKLRLEALRFARPTLGLSSAIIPRARSLVPPPGVSQAALS